jgi:hypothetical protein
MTAMARSTRREILTGIWLSSRDLVHLGGRRRLGPALMLGYGAFCALLVVGGLLAHARSRAVPVGGIFTPIWVLWALLPAVGAGGGTIEAAGSLAPYPTGPALQLTSSWFSALTDVQYLLPVPVLLASVSTDFGAAGLIGAAAFVLGASALGQLAGWFSVAGLRARRGQSLLVTAVAVIGLGALAVSRRGQPAEARHLGTIPPTRWLVHASHAADHGEWLAACGWWALLGLPAALLVAVGPPLVRRATVARLAGATAPPGGAAFGRSPARALAAASWRGIVRSMSWRATLLAVVAVPFLTTLLSDPLTYRTLASVSVVSAGATLAANTWAYEAGGITMLLSAPLSRRTAIAVRSAVLAAALATSLAVATAAAVIAGGLRGGPSDVGFAACILVVVTAAGMRTSVAGASATDVDSLRARPAALTSVLTFGGRCLLSCLFVAAGWAFGLLGAAIAAAGSLGYAAWALRGTSRRFADGARLLAAFATVR